jgi:LuxR family transcriptional activator of bioluminescence operon
MSKILYSDLYEMLGSVESEQDLFNLCTKVCEFLNFEYFVFGVMSSSGSLSSPSVSTLSNYPDNWFKSYFDDAMQKHDPVVRYCLQNTSPIRWNNLLQMDQYIDAIGEQFMARAAQVGLCDGLSIPLKAPSGEVAIFSLSSRREEKIDDRVRQALPYAQSFSASLFEHYIRIIPPKSEESSSSLTAREKENLFWACEGKTAWEISKIIGVSERTVIFHLTSATKKLGAVNRQHAVAKAIHQGLIKPAF